jgi:hypothetical protein
MICRHAEGCPQKLFALRDHTVKADIENLAVLKPSRDHPNSGHSSLSIPTRNFRGVSQKVGKLSPGRSPVFLMDNSGAAPPWEADPHEKRILVPASVTSITPASFPIHSAAEFIEFDRGSQLTCLPGSAFNSCKSLKRIIIPPSVITIDRRCFCAVFSGLPLERPLKSITFERGSRLRELGPLAFLECRRLKSICLPASLELADGESFCKCGLTRIAVEAGNRHFAVRDAFLLDITETRIVRYFGQEGSIRDKITVLGRYSFAHCDRLTGLEFGPHSRLQSIEDCALSDCSSVIALDLPPSTMAIGANCFACCELFRLSFGEKSVLESVGGYAFHYCRLLRTITIPSTVEFLDESCFCDCARLFQVVFAPGSKLVRMEKSAFCNCGSLESFCLPASVEFVGRHCFQGCDRLFDFSFESPSRVSSLLDMPPALNEVIDIHDSVTDFVFPIDARHVRNGRRATFCFGRESRLESVSVQRLASSRVGKCFLQLASRTVKEMREEREFGDASRPPWQPLWTLPWSQRLATAT